MISSTSHVDIENVIESPQTLTQFLLDCTSDNLQPGQKIMLNDPELQNIFIISRRIIMATHNKRISLLKNSKEDDSI